MKDKEKKNKIVDILLDFYEEYHSNEINRPMIPSIYAGKIINSLQEEPVNKDFEMALAEMIDKAQKCVVEPLVVAEQWKDELIKLAKGEEPISEELEDAAIRASMLKHDIPKEHLHEYLYNDYGMRKFVEGAKWQEEKDDEEKVLTYKHGFEDCKEQMMANATEVTVHIDAGGYPYIPQMELYDYDKDVPLAKEGDKYKVVLIKEG